MSTARLVAAIAVTVVLVAIVVGCQATVNRWSQAPSSPSTVEIDRPKFKVPKVTKPKAPAYKAPSRSRR